LSPTELQEFLHRSVPLSRAMGVAVEAITPDSVVLAAPFEQNINQHGTVFGGSSATLSVLAAWSLLHTRLMLEGIDVKLVVQRSAMEYEAPMAGRFTATATLAPVADWRHFVDAIRAKGKARIQVLAIVGSSSQPAGRFQGDFVAVREAGSA
jgi:thioesterase domain-containing protein